MFPADLLTLCVRGAQSIEGAHLNFVRMNVAFKARSGDGADLGRLFRADYVDILIHDKQGSAGGVAGLDHLHSWPMRPDTPFFVLLSWTGVDGKPSSGQVGVIWTHQDRLEGRRPRIAYGDAADELRKYVEDSEAPITGALLRRMSRARQMTRFDISQRCSRDRMGKEMTTSSSLAPRVNSLTVSGFRGFRQPAVLNLARPAGAPGSGLTIVVGANNAGKSTIWESFEALARKQRSDVSFSEGRRNRNSPDGIIITLRRDDGSEYTLESRGPNTSETKAGWNPLANEQTIEVVAVPSRRQFQPSFSKNVAAQRDWMSSSFDFSRFQQRDQFTGRLFELHNDEIKKANFDQLMQEVLGYQLAWTIDLADGEMGSSYYLKVTTDEGVNHTSEGLGDGIISLLFVLNALYDSEPETLLVIDEPELSLHPQLVRRLGRVLARFAAHRQIVVFTHSPVLVSWDDIANGAEIARVYKVKGDSQIAQAQRTTVEEISKARGGWRNPHTLGADANEALFLDDGVVVVEGQEDAALLPRAFSNLGIEFSGSIFGWGAGGADNVQKIVALLSDLAFQRVAVLLDNNVLPTVARLRSRFPDYLVTEIPAADIRDKPESNRPAVFGLFDESGKSIKTDLQRDARTILTTLNEFVTDSKPVPRE